MSDPITAMAVGAALGGGTSLAQGKGFGSALKSAAIGGALGGGGSALGGLMGGAGATGAAGGASSSSGLLSGLKGVEVAVPSLGSGGYAALGQQALTPIGGAATGGINFANIGSNLGGTNLPIGGQGISNLSSYANPLTNVAENSIGIGTQGLGSASVNLGNIGGADVRRLAVDTPLSFGDKFTDMISNPLSSLSTSDKLGLGMKSFDALNQPQQQMQTPPVMPITRGNPDMVSSPLYNVAPNVGIQEGNDIGLPNLLSKMPLTEEEILRLQQQMQTAGFRGR